MNIFELTTEQLENLTEEQREEAWSDWNKNYKKQGFKQLMFFDKEDKHSLFSSIEEIWYDDYFDACNHIPFKDFKEKFEEYKPELCLCETTLDLMKFYTEYFPEETEEFPDLECVHEEITDSDYGRRGYETFLKIFQFEGDKRPESKREYFGITYTQDYDHEVFEYRALHPYKMFKKRVTVKKWQMA